jgi:hypothetical protein
MAIILAGVRRAIIPVIIRRGIERTIVIGWVAVITRIIIIGGVGGERRACRQAHEPGTHREAVTPAAIIAPAKIVAARVAAITELLPICSIVKSPLLMTQRATATLTPS